MKQNPKNDGATVTSSLKPAASAMTAVATTATTVATAATATTVAATASTACTSDINKATEEEPLTFGIQSKKTKVSMTDLLRCIPSEMDEETDYPDLSGMTRKGRLPPAKSTKASRMLVTCREERPEEEVRAVKAVEEFKMKKFLNVPSKVECRRT